MSSAISPNGMSWRSSRFRDEFSLRLSDVDLIGFHGQTVLHRPERRLTVQLGDGQLLADRPAVPSCSTCAPPTLPQAGRARLWFRSIIVRLPLRFRKDPSAFVNIGGVANVTWIGAEGELLGFRYRSRQCVDRRLDFSPYRKNLRLGRSSRLAWQDRRRRRRAVPRRFLISRSRRRNRSIETPSRGLI